MPGIPRRTVPTRQRRSVESIVDRLRETLGERLDGWLAHVSVESGSNGQSPRGRDPRLDGPSARERSSSASTGRERGLPEVPDRYRDTALDVLAHPWSRYVFYHVRDRAHRSVSVAELTDDLLEWVPPEDSDDVDRSDVAEAVWEHHVPALAAQGLLRFDREDGAVHYVDRCGIEDSLAAQAQWDPNELLSRT